MFLCLISSSNGKGNVISFKDLLIFQAFAGIILLAIEGSSLLIEERAGPLMNVSSSLAYEHHALM
jgi:hypothetical protein